MTILSICQDVMDELGLIRPTILVGSGDPNATRLLAVARRAGQALYRAHDWSILQREHEFSTTTSVDNYAVPEDWGRPLGSTAWDRTTFWRTKGNLTPQQWQVRKSSLAISPALRFGYRLLVGPLAGSILLDPVPTGSHDLVIEYVSRYWSEDAAGNGQAELAADTDEIRLDHELYTLGVRWRVRESFGFTYADQRADYEAAVKSAIASDLNMPVVNLGQKAMRPYPNLPEGSWGQ